MVTATVFWRRLGTLATVIVVVTIFVGCEALFTTNLFENFARDPENMSQEQLVAYAQEAIASGNVERMEEAFDALLDKTEGSELDSETRRTLVELGLGATDTIGFVGQNLDDPESIDVGEFDEDKRRIARETAKILNDAPDDEFSADRYAYAGAGLVLAAAAEAGDITEIDTDGDDAELARDMLDKSLEKYEAEGREDDEVYRQLSDLKDDYL